MYMLLKPQHLDKNAHGLINSFSNSTIGLRRITSKYSWRCANGIKRSRLCSCIAPVHRHRPPSLFKYKPTGFIPTEDEGRYIITYELPESASTTRSIEVLTKIMQVVKETPGVGHFAALGGLNVLPSRQINGGTIFCQLNHGMNAKTRPNKCPAL